MPTDLKNYHHIFSLNILLQICFIYIIYYYILKNSQCIVYYAYKINIICIFSETVIQLAWKNSEYSERDSLGHGLTLSYNTISYTLFRCIPNNNVYSVFSL